MRQLTRRLLQELIFQYAGADDRQAAHQPRPREIASHITAMRSEAEFNTEAYEWLEAIGKEIDAESDAERAWELSVDVRRTKAFGKIKQQIGPPQIAIIRNSSVRCYIGKEMLKCEDLAVSTFISYGEYVDAEQYPDCIISGWVIGDHNYAGDLLYRITTIPIVIWSVSTEEEPSLIAQGAFAFVEDPCQPQVLIDIVHKALAIPVYRSKRGSQ